MASAPVEAHGSSASRPGAARALARAGARAAPGALPLGRYRDEHDRPRELVVRRGAADSRLLIDRDSRGGGAERLVAHIAGDEPEANIAIVARLYLASAPERRRCRRATRQDELEEPLPARGPDAEVDAACSGRPGVEGPGCAYRLAPLPSRASIPQLRWTAVGAGRSPVASRRVSLREAVAGLERYEPLCELTRRAIAIHRDDPAVSTTVLQAELVRVLESPIVLNRGLREAVLARVAGGRASLSEIAIRCGRVKRDSRGNLSGETSWLARRIGLLPEGGQPRPTPWVHSDVLGLIARDGLGLSPREVELA